MTKKTRIVNVPETSISSAQSNASIDKNFDGNVQIPGATAQMSEAEALLYRHPDYINGSPKWRKYIDTYEAEDIYRYIYRHLRETDVIFNDRVGRGYYYNYVASVVDLFIAYLFQTPITRTIPAAQSALYEDFLVNVDFGKTRWEQFMPLTATFGMLTGHDGILVDMPRLPENGFPNEQARKDAGHRPFCQLIQANQILDWEHDEFYNLEWVKLLAAKPAGRIWRQEVNENIERYVIWRRDSWEEWLLVDGDEARLQADGPNPLGEVPLVIHHNEKAKRHDWFGLSAVRDISDINIAILNWCSLGDEEIFNRCLNILIAEKMGDDSALEFSQYNVLEYEAGTNPPQYLVPGTTPLTLIGDWVDRAKDEIYRLAKMGGSTGMQGTRQATSGIAYAFEFNETNQTLANKAALCEATERRVLELVANWQGDTFDGVVDYPREFGVDDFLHEFQILAEGRSSLTSETAVKEIEKRLTDKLFVREAQDLRLKIRAEIEKADPKLGLQKPDTPPEGGDSETRPKPSGDKEEESEE